MCTALLTAAFGALSNALALGTRQEETTIACAWIATRAFRAYQRSV